MVIVYKEKDVHATVVKFAFYGIVIGMKKFFAFAFFVAVFLPATSFAVSQELVVREYINFCDTECDYVNPPQIASVGGTFRMGGCRDPKAQNYDVYATYDSGECVYSDGSRIAATSTDLIRGADGAPIGGTHSALEREAREYRAVPDFFTSKEFVNGKVHLAPESIQKALESIQCKNNLLDNTISPRTKLGSDEVKKLQKFLKERSGKSVLVTGNYRAQTTRAVGLLQASYFKPGTYTKGIVDVKTKDFINFLECQALFGEYLNQNN